jgi:hypothetical protein
VTRILSLSALVLALARAQSAPVDPQHIPLEQLTNMAGDVSGVRVPALAPICASGEDPTTHVRCAAENGRAPRGLLEGAIFTPAINIFRYPQRQQIFDAYTIGAGVQGRPRGYTHMAVHLQCTEGARNYHAIFPPHPCNGAFLNALLHEMYDHSPPIIPLCFVMNDDADAVHLPEDFDRSLCRIVVPKWEYPVADCDLKAVRAAFPEALLYWENPASQTAPKADACAPQPFPSGRAWFQHAQRAYGLRGILIETDIRVLGADPAAAARAIEQARPVWQDMQAVLFETDIYQKFWEGRTEAESVAYNDAIRKAVPWLRGFMSGGTPRFARN